MGGLLTLLQCELPSTGHVLLPWISNMRPSHRLQFKNCPSMGLFHGMQSTDSSTVGPLRGHKSCQQTCFRVGWSSTGSRWILTHSGPPWTARRFRVVDHLQSMVDCNLTMVFTAGCREFLLWHLEHPLPLLFQQTWCLRNCFCHIFSLPSLECNCTCWDVFPLFNMSSHRPYHCHWWLWPVVGLFWSHLTLALSYLGVPLAPSLRSRPCSPPWCQNLATQTQYRMLEGKRELLCVMVWMQISAWLGDHSRP